MDSVPITGRPPALQPWPGPEIADINPVGRQHAAGGHFQPMSNAAQIVDSYPLSPMQQGMLYHALSEPHSGVDIEQLTIVLREPVDAMRLRLAWERVVARHPVLRTSFTVTDTGPKQVVCSEVDLPFEAEDWSDQADEQKEARFEAWL